MHLFSYTADQIMDQLDRESFGHYLIGYIDTELERGNALSWDTIEFAFDAYLGGAR